MSEDTILAISSTEYPIHLHVDSSNVGTGCILIQQFSEGKRIVSFTSRIIDKAEQKKFTLHRELCGIVSELQTYEHYNIGSLFPNTCIVIINPFFISGDAEDSYPTGSFRYQVIITKFQILKTIWTPGSNLAFPDILSQNVTIDEYQHQQLQHKKPQRDIQFFDELGHQIT